ncbi:MAG: class I SAM-dependent methyltransferase [Bacteroidales bacterium]
MMMKQKNSYAKMTQYYDNVLTGRKWWSKIYMKYLWKVDDNFIAKEVLDMLPNNFEGKLLDVPIGTAVFTYNKYSKLPKALITGLDYSHNMLEMAKMRFNKENITNVELIQADATNLPFDKESFDCILSMNGIHAFPQKNRALDEIYRTLKKGGIFLGCFYIKGERIPADWFVKIFLNKKGFFRAPHYTFHTAEAKLHSLFGDDVVIKNTRSMFIFKCIK